MLGNVSEGDLDFSIAGLNDITGDETTSKLVFLNENVAVRERSHIGVVMLSVGRRLGVGMAVWNGERSQNSHEWRKDGLNLGGGLVVSCNWVDDKECITEVEDNHGTVVNHCWEQSMEFGDGFVEFVGCRINGSKG